MHRAITTLSIAPKLLLVALVAGTSLLGSRGPAWAAGSLAPHAPASDPVGEATIYTYANGPSNCNCTDARAELSVCHSESVSVSIGGSGLTVSTGLSKAGCAAQPIEPDHCIYYQYNFVCTKSGWFGWDCSLLSSALKARPATDADCFDPAG